MPWINANKLSYQRHLWLWRNCSSLFLSNQEMGSDCVHSMAGRERCRRDGVQDALILWDNSDKWQKNRGGWNLATLFIHLLKHEWKGLNSCQLLTLERFLRAGKKQDEGVGDCSQESDQVHGIHPCVATSISTLSSQEYCQQGEAHMSSGETDWGKEGLSWNWRNSLTSFVCSLFSFSISLT